MVKGTSKKTGLWRQQNVPWMEGTLLTVHPQSTPQLQTHSNSPSITTNTDRKRFKIWGHRGLPSLWWLVDAFTQEKIIHLMLAPQLYPKQETLSVILTGQDWGPRALTWRQGLWYGGPDSAPKQRCAMGDPSPWGAGTAEEWSLLYTQPTYSAATGQFCSLAAEYYV